MSILHCAYMLLSAVKTSLGVGNVSLYWANIVNAADHSGGVGLPPVVKK